MYLHPYLGSELAREKQRDMIAQAERLNQGHRARYLTQGSGRATWVERWMLRCFTRRRPAALAADQPPAGYELQEGDGLVVKVELIHPSARG